ncbi:galactose-1-phosphate uridylyltransferase [Actinocorallia sp. A-T 12471]|uniref:galactose-1-phosphate uridylyltransferase n=1 Tax=Actinocorallia sp. A-T 12471 TaxID=3089813 RepID=UPI0029D239F2|nr:galactose-1-phosphate uridylyltransferase [Actinocorallia sp. A-T 12471]MDX6740196.1 galactose-1-phosphate uridylyltransferase [Actinocorallia sp. A-T 12471]
MHGLLADGREIVYYDDRPGRDRSARDTRPLTAFAPRGELRHDPLTGDPVLIAAHRQTRTVNSTRAGCPLCPSRPGSPTEIPAADYDVAVFENRFPSLGGQAGGRCEVVCFSGEHDQSVSRLPAARLTTIGRAWADRTAALTRLPGVEQVFVFENRGAEVGATLAHPHGQIYAYPYLTPVQRSVLRSARAHRTEHGSCLLCHTVAREADGPRVVAATAQFVAYVPESARWPFEVHLAPRSCVGDLAALAPAEITELMGLYAEVLRRFEGLFTNPTPYMACWHQAPVRHRADLDHFYGQVFTTRRSADKYKFLASSESAAGAFINDVLPEAAAERLRAVRI